MTTGALQYLLGMGFLTPDTTSRMPSTGTHANRNRAGQTALTENGAECRRKQRKGKESLWLSEAPVKKNIWQMHTPARTSPQESAQTQYGLEVCIRMHLVNGTGSSLSLGQPTPE